MHSSRMSTVRSSGRRGGSARGVSAQRVSAQEGVCLGIVCPVGVSACGGCLPGGMYTSLPVDRMTDACENITFPQLLLRMVTRMHSSRMRRACFNGHLTQVMCLGMLGVQGGVHALNPEADTHLHEQNDRDRCKNITLPQTAFAGGNKPAF